MWIGKTWGVCRCCDCSIRNLINVHAICFSCKETAKLAICDFFFFFFFFVLNFKQLSQDWFQIWVNLFWLLLFWKMSTIVLSNIRNSFNITVGLPDSMDLFGIFWHCSLPWYVSQNSKRVECLWSGPPCRYSCRWGFRDSFLCLLPGDLLSSRSCV